MTFTSSTYPKDPDRPLSLTGRRIGKYLVEECLGEGGMGQVFKAQDTTLGRTVALKLVLRTGDESALRLMLEAQALARIEHPHICRIHEVGDFEGRPYIAMQYVAGVTLHSLQAQLPQREKVDLLRKVAEAMHSAHRLGLVHRDLKPANIMVERDTQGAWSPVVLDFGLVRDVGGSGLTLTGMPLGTPDFMSPEQAEGEAARVDRRSDVFSLGATLFYLLLGHAPFAGSGPLATLRRLTEAEPAAPRSLDPALPLDLETILLKCLEKEPARRYDTARALADDLQCYLDGDPISAQRSSWLGRLRRKARRNRALTMVGTTAALLLVALLALMIRNRVVLERTSKLAMQMGLVAKDVDAIMHTAHLVPEHSLAPEKALVRVRMAEVEALLHQLPEASSGPAHHALGRGHMALGEWGQAYTSLERAWQQGYRAPESALALGEVMADLYQRRLRSASQLSDPKIRDQALNELNTQLRDPAFAYLQAGRSASPSPPYIEALILNLQGRSEEALQKIQVSKAQAPGVHEASLLEGAIHQQRYIEHVGLRDWAAVDQDEARVRAAYEGAAIVARSDPRALEGLDCLLIFVHNDRSVYRAQNWDGLLDEVETLSARLLKVDSESARGHCCKAYVRWRRSSNAATNQVAIEEARLATQFDPDDDYGWVLRAATLSRAVDYAWQAGQDPEAAIAESLKASQELLRLVPRTGHQGLIALEKIAKAHLRRFQHRVESDAPSEALEADTLAQIRNGFEADPRYQYFEQMLGWFHLHRAWRAMAMGGDPSEGCNAILAIDQRPLPDPAFTATRAEQRLWALLTQAEYSLRSQQPAALPLEAAQRALRAIPASGLRDAFEARLALLETQAEFLAGRHGTAALTRAERSTQHLLTTTGKGATRWQAMAPRLQAEIHLRRAEVALLAQVKAPPGLWPTEAWLAPGFRPGNPSRQVALREVARGLAVTEHLAPDWDAERPGTAEALRASLSLLQHCLSPQTSTGSVVEPLAKVIRRDALLAPLLAPHLERARNLEAGKFPAPRGA